MSYDEARMSGAYFMSSGTAYMIGTHGGGPTFGSLEGGELERCFLRANIARCCDGDDHTAHATLPDRYTSTVENALRWYARSTETTEEKWTSTS